LRIVVFSDSHGSLNFARKALKDSGRVDLILHAGDHYRDGFELAAEAGLPVQAVLGNCDRFDEGPAEVFLETKGGVILMVHGHAGGAAGRRLEEVLVLVRECKAKLVVFGHTHMANIIKESGVLFFNPGSISCPRDRERPSYGILEVKGKGIIPSIHRI